MNRPLRLLMVEDTPEDAELVLRELRRGGFTVSHERVETKQAFQSALLREAWSAILADFSLPTFSAIEAYEVLRGSGLDIPFIIVSGTVGEEAAVTAMRSGVHDFVLKDRLQRLVPAVERELREAHMRSERGKMREQLMVADRMASVGMLAASVIHEINNPLAAVLANLDLASDRLSQLNQSEAGQPRGLEELAAELSDAREAADRLRIVTSDLRMFSRAPEDKAQPVDVRRVLESSLRIAGNEVRHRAQLSTHFEDVPPVNANESRLGQVFLNLIINAAQAIETGMAGQHLITVGTRRSNDGQVIIEISDTGCGMSPEVLKKLFTPFFTTKPPGMGNGLGLTICRRLISEAGGEISVESTLGKGTTFRVSLPTAHGAVKKEAPNVAAATAGRRGRVLVVDDEQMIVNVVRRSLAEHEVVALTSARAALQLVVSGERFDLILSDLMMPEMSGLRLLAELKAQVPEQADRLVFMSGGALSGPHQESLTSMSNRSIQKPFTPVELRRLVDDCLRSADLGLSVK